MIYQANAVASLSTGEKVRMLRKHGKMAQNVLAEFIQTSPTKITAIERGQDEYSEALLCAVKNVFRIEGLPLTERERYAFKERLYRWRDLVRSGRMEEAKAIHAEIANIDRLAPCDIDLVILCKMFEAVLLITVGDYEAAEKNINKAEQHSDEISLETLYHYYCCKGSINAIQDDSYFDGLEWYLKAYELTEIHDRLLPSVDSTLIYNISACYTRRALPHSAVFFLQKAKLLYANEKIMSTHVYIDAMFALNQIIVNRLNEAGRLLEKCSLKAESFRDSTLIGYILYVYGRMHERTKNWRAAIEHFDKAINCLPESSTYYHVALYHKIHSITQTKALAKATRELESAKVICGTNNVWATYFSALDHYIVISGRMTLNNDESCKYIEDVAIPYFFKRFDYFTALDYYRFLKTHYLKSRSLKKVAQIEIAISKIHERFAFHS